MNKKEISELKKTLTKDRTCVSVIAGCYVNGDKQKLTTFKKKLLTLPEEEIHKYVKLLKSCLSGKIGEKLINLDFNIDSEVAGSGHEKLMNLRGNELDSDNAVEELFDMIIDNYDYPENYLILLANGVYDIPGSLDDASDYIYDHIICAICPVKLSKEGLSYYSDENAIRDRDRDWVVGTPINGFLFPAFNNRNTDIHSMLYFTKTGDSSNAEFVKNTFDIDMPLFAKEQKAMLDDAIITAFEDNCSYETVRIFYETLEDIAFEHKEDEESYSLSKKDIQRAFEQAGADEDVLKRFSDYYDNVVDNKNIQSDNLIGKGTTTIKTANANVKVDKDFADAVEIKVVDGEKCIVIPVRGDIDTDGIIIK